MQTIDKQYSGEREKETGIVSIVKVEFQGVITI